MGQAQQPDFTLGIGEQTRLVDAETRDPAEAPEAPMAGVTSLCLGVSAARARVTNHMRGL